MDVIKIVLDELKNKSIHAIYEKSAITWHDNFNEEHCIYETDIDFLSGKLAWFQSSNSGKHLLRLFNNDECFNWEPITHNNVFGCDCHLIEWNDDYLIFVYREKHDVYICVIKDKVVTYFNFYGEEITRKNDVFFFREYRSQSSNMLKRLKLPELIQLDPVTEEDALKEGIVIASIEYSNNLRYGQ